MPSKALRKIDCIDGLFDRLRERGIYGGIYGVH